MSQALIIRLRHILAVTFFFTVTPVLSEDTRSANTYLQGCKDIISRTYNFEAGRCMGTIEGIGLLQTYNIYCPPKTATLAQMVRVILAYIEGHPERMHEDFR